MKQTTHSDIPLTGIHLLPKPLKKPKFLSLFVLTKMVFTTTAVVKVICSIILMSRFSGQIVQEHILPRQNGLFKNPITSEVPGISHRPQILAQKHRKPGN